MKKKASLWISGITTVAMLAVAVGSFAAWDSLEKEGPTFSATSGSPVVLDVKTGTDNFTTKTLVPANAILNETSDVTELNGAFTPTFKDSSDTDTNKSLSVCATLEVTSDSSLSSLVDIKVYKADDADRANEITKTNITDASGSTIADAYKLDAGTEYVVVAKFNDGDITDASAIKGKNIAAKVTCKAYKEKTTA